MIRGGLRKLLLARTTVTAIVGSNGVFIERPEQGSKRTRCEIHLANDDENLTLGGGLPDSDELFSTEIDIDCRGKRPGDANKLADAVAAILRDYTGTAGNQTILAVNLNGKGTSFENPIDASDQALHNMSLEFTIHWREQ